MDDIQLLASILQGEAAVLGPAGMTAVAAVFIARLLSPAFPCTVSTVAPAFYGRAQPGAEALAIAEHALSDPTAFLVSYYPGNHIEKMLYYCFSAQDRARLGLPPGDRQFIRSRTWQLHLYKEDPLAPDHAIPAAPVRRPVHRPAFTPHQDIRLR